MLFRSPGSATIKSQSFGILQFLSELLTSEELIDEEIRVEGHTDNVPNISAQYPSNWELSTARATNVVRYFIEQSNFTASRLSAAGYSEYHPIDSNDTNEGRSSNRRVDIVVINKQIPISETEETDTSGGN